MKAMRHAGRGSVCSLGRTAHAASTAVVPRLRTPVPIRLLAQLAAAAEEAAAGRPDVTRRISAGSAQAGAKALKLLAKADQVIARTADASSSSSSSSSSGPQQTFQTERRLLSLGSSGSGGKPEITVNTLYVRRAAAGSLSSRVMGNEDSSLAPMLVRLETEPTKIARHALYWLHRRGQAAANDGPGDAERAEQQQQQAIAAFVLAGGQLPARVKLLLRGVSDARRQLRDEGSKDIMFSVERSVQELSEEEHQKWQARRAALQQQQQEETDEAAAAADGGAKSSSSEQQSPTKATYIIKVYTCQPKASARRAGRSSSSSSSSSSSGRRRSARPGFVGVPAAEWAALREQLEVVPGLTQQLQTMTRQHEQLLGLLAAQGGAGSSSSSSRA
ncbi:hypothetical protein OEZ85_002327 [Tetradesmus obliquus]|uniref:Uncharacterized protein n=1 Tax=Tetradesmus obliquus TaxID=3088 RepID=A0ABY8U6U2_TETOB|nr:hypothetical protein OEZ85_002327 [Tetradesmus obliquus]